MNAVIGHDYGLASAWDSAMIVIDPPRHLAPNGSVVQACNRVDRPKGFAGINGFYHCYVMTLWSPTLQTWKIVSEQTGFPLGK